MIQQAIRAIRILLPATSSVTPQQIEDAVTQILFVPSFAAIDKAILIREVQAIYNIRMDEFRIIEKEEIQAVVRRKFLSRSYGFGWFPGYGRYYNASSGEGLQLYLKNGKRFYFSTTHINFFDAAMKRLINPLQKSSLSEF